MKRRILFTLVIFSFGFIMESNAQIDFIMEDWNKALEQAKAQNKYIVVDAYTEWCGWCKVMDKKTFTDPEVIAFYGQNFIALKLDMEKGVGIDLAIKYRVSAFPSILYFNPEGKLVYRTVGYREVEPFIIDGKNALDREEQFEHPGDPMIMDPGFPDFYINSFKKGKEREWPEQAIVTNFLESQENLYDEISWAVMRRFNLEHDHEQFLLLNMDQYRKYYGDIEVDSKFSSITYAYLRRAIKEKDETVLEEAIDLNNQYGNPEDTASLASMYRIHYFKQLKQWERYSDLVVEDVETREPRAATLNDYAWTIYENIDDVDAINRAIEWMSEVIAQHPEYSYVDTYAALLFKAKRYDEAEAYALEAITIGREEKAKIEGTQKLLGKIRKAAEGSEE